MKKSVLHKAISVARTKMHRHPEFFKFIHYSFIVQDNKILGYGRNHASTPRKHYGYNKLSDDDTFVPKTHSEVNAYVKVRGIMDKDEGFSIVNIRLNRKGEIKMSKPCPCCYELLKELGCTEFYYSSEVGFMLVR